VTRIRKRRLPTLLLAVSVVWLAATIAILPGSRAASPTAPVALLDPIAAVLKGTVTLTATVTPSTGRTVSSVVFERSPAGTGQWSTLATVATAPYSATLDTTSLTNGAYDFRVTATDSAGESGTSPTLTSTVNNPSPPPTVTLTDPGQRLHGVATLVATASAAAGHSIVSVEFAYSPAGSVNWTSIGVATQPPYQRAFDTTQLPDGPYDFRATATDDQGLAAVDTATDRLIANTPETVQLNDPGAVLHGTATLNALISVDTTSAVTTEFQLSPSGKRSWSPVASVDVTPRGRLVSTPVTGSFNTTSLPDGPVDLRAVTTNTDAGTVVYSPVLKSRIDNTAPTVTLSPIAPSVSGRVTLRATADDGATGSGVAQVRFEWSTPGSTVWTPIGFDGTSPYSTTWDTTQRPNGSYVVRARAIDEAQNESSATSSPFEISNAPQPQAPLPSIRTLAAPAHGLTLLGAVAGSPEHEAWAYGFTSAAPAEVDGHRLPYTSPGNQFVLLRYGDSSGWRIEDVLRGADGQSPFPLLPADQSAASGLLVRGAMAATGEGWLWVKESSTRPGAADVYGLFHRAAGASHFVLDASATAALGARLLDPPVGGANAFSAIRLGAAADGTPFGVLLSPAQAPTSVNATSANGAPVTVQGRLQFATLDGTTWTSRTAEVPSNYAASPGEQLSLNGADLATAGTGWAIFSATSVNGSSKEPLLLSRFTATGWTTVSTEVDALDLRGAAFASGSAVVPTGLYARGGEVWIGALVNLPGGQSPVVVRYDGANGGTLDAWCGLTVLLTSAGCTGILDADHQAAVPDASFDTAGGELALALDNGFVDVFTGDDWRRVAAPGFSAGGSSAFGDPTTGWLAGPTAFGRWSLDKTTALVPWPQANRNPIVAIAQPPGSDGSATSPGAISVGLGGAALKFDPGSGWLVTPLPPRASHVNLLGVAFADPTHAVAVGQFGTILRWDGTTWTEDPQTLSITTNQLNAVAFGADGTGYAVGTFGTILRYDGSSWSTEEPPAEDSGVDITSVTVAGGDVFAVAGGNLIERSSDGTWHRIDPSLLPSDPAPASGDLTLVSGLPDGGVVAAGQSILINRAGPGQPFEYAPQPIEGTAVALAATRDQSGALRSFVSIAPATNASSGVQDAGFPPGDGELIRQTPDGGWQDLSEAQYPGGALPADGMVKVDPVLAIAASPDGGGAWAVGGYAGTPDSADRGSNAILSARPTGWLTSSIWRFDTGTQVQPPSIQSGNVTIPAQQGTVSFAFFSSALCRASCASALDAQPDVNLTGAATQIAQFAKQPGGPAFAVLGGNARGPIDADAYAAGNGAADLARLPDLLAPLGSLPLFAAYGPLDAVPTLQNPAQAWDDAFSASPAPFGSAPAPTGIAPVASGEPDGNIHRYYAFDATQNGGTLRVVVLDNSAGSLEGTSPGQTAWLQTQLADARSKSLPVVVVAALPLRSNRATDGNDVAAMLANAGVLAVFTTNSPFQLNEKYLVPDNAPAGAPQIPEYEGASLGYQDPSNNGVAWYDVSVDTASRQVHVDAIPVVDSLALKPLQGLTVNRSFTLQFQAIARRPVGSLATTTSNDSFPGFDDYVEIPAPDCGGRPCIQPSFRFSSSDPTIGDFVVPSGPGSRFPQVDSSGHTTSSSTSGLFCAYNTGTTTVSITTGLSTYSLPVTVESGGFGPPCGTVFRPGVNPIVHVQQQSSNANATPPPPPPAPAPVATELPLPTFVPPPPPPAPAPLPPTVIAPPAVHAPPPAPAPAPAPAPVPAPAPPAPAPAAPPARVPVPEPQPFSPVAVVPPPVPPVQPVPPGGAVAQAPSAAPRKEKARKHASQSAFTIRPAGADAATWFFAATGGSAVLVVAVLGWAVRPGRKSVPAPVARGIDSGLRPRPRR
jgi:hypothetical protein